MKKTMLSRLGAALVALLLLVALPFLQNDTSDPVSDDISGFSAVAEGNGEEISLPSTDADADAAPERGNVGENADEEDLTISTIDITSEEDPAIDADGVYTTKDDVALYLSIYGELPGNFITKRQAQALGWSGGGLESYAPGKCIGGDVFGNYEGMLPEASGRVYRECDIDTLGANSRGAKRIVYSNDGLIFYTDDHYESFTLLYGEWEK